MTYSRREFLQLIAAGVACGLCKPRSTTAYTSLELTSPNRESDSIYEIPRYGNASLLHITDCHAQLLPTYYREPHIHLGFARNPQQQIPHIVGKYFLERFKIPYRTNRAYALTFLDFPELAMRYGKTGGFAHIATLVKNLRASRPNSLLLDGGDTWQGSATSLWTQGQDMVDATKLLGVDIMTGHWEFTYGMDRVKHIVNHDLKGHIEFVAQNIVDNEFEDPLFKPFVIREINGIPIAIIGQAFPYQRVAHPKRFTENYRFGIREGLLQENVDKARQQGAQVVVLLSHNGMDLDLKLASRVSGIDFILGGHTHDAIPEPVVVHNRRGTTVVTNSGTNGKFVGVLDLNVQKGKLKGYQYRLVPVFANLLPPDPKMQAYIDQVRQPYLNQLAVPLAQTDDLLFRRDTFNGTFDQLILDALMETQDTEIAFSPGFRWGTTLLSGTTITMEDVMAQTAITYPIVTRSAMSGETIKTVLEDIADNRFSDDPYLQQGGDMVRVGGLQYRIDPTAKMGKRISALSLNGSALSANKTYLVAGWASMQELAEGQKIWDAVASYLKDKKTISIKQVNTPKLPDLTNNVSYQAPFT